MIICESIRSRTFESVLNKRPAGGIFVMTRQTVQTATSTKVRTRAKVKKDSDELLMLEPQEEHVVRMRSGTTLDGSAELTMMDELPGMPAEAVAQIRAIERRALEMRGQLKPITAKSRIIASLKKKAAQEE